jgi:hypothetical protein
MLTPLKREVKKRDAKSSRELEFPAIDIYFAQSHLPSISRAFSLENTPDRNYSSGTEHQKP